MGQLIQSVSNLLVDRNMLRRTLMTEQPRPLSMPHTASPGIKHPESLRRVKHNNNQNTRAAIATCSSLSGHRKQVPVQPVRYTMPPSIAAQSFDVSDLAISQLLLRNGALLTFPDRKLLSLATYLEQIAVLLVQVYTLRSKALLRSVMKQYFAAHFFISFPDPYRLVVDSFTPESYAEVVSQYLKDFPSFRSDTYSATALVNEREGVAQVLTTGQVMGTDNNNPHFVREGASLYYFRAEQGEWLCTGIQQVNCIIGQCPAYSKEDTDPLPRRF